MPCSSYHSRPSCLTIQTLFCRRRDLDDLIMAMDDFVPPGSEVHLYNEVPVGDREVLLLNGGLNVDSLQVSSATQLMRISLYK
jgi:hypothetical protein